MKKPLFLLLTICLSVTLLVACGEGDGGKEKDPCTHADKDDNGKCDECGAAFEDGDETPETPDEPADCEHKDADENGKCDECGDDFSDGCDAQHRDADDNGKCDVGGEDFEDGCEHIDADDDCECDKCKEPFDDGFEFTPTLIYNKTTVPTIVAKTARTYEEKYAYNSVRTAHASIETSLTVRPKLSGDSTAAGYHEIVIGDTSREITATAKALLEEKLLEKKDELLDRGYEENDIAAYLIYSNGESVAIVWTHFQIAPVAVEYFLETYANGTELMLYDGFTKTNFLSLDGYLQEREDGIFLEKWAALEAAIPEEYRDAIMTEYRKLYSLYDDKVVEWLGSLYDPETGGWYNATSAKVTSGYLPDIESTYYGLTLIGYTGMAELFGGSWSSAVPADILTKAAQWIYTLQDADGYFYHPQWPKEYIEANNRQLRITRDIGSAKTILKAAGISPKYTGYSASESSLFGSLGTSTVVAASKVVYASSLLWEFESVENFKRYLSEHEESLKTMSDSSRANSFYSFGSHFQATVGLLTPEMRVLVEEYFDKHQNPKNGMWSENLYYGSTNAFHKICSVYNSIGAEMKCAEQIVDSTLEILKWDVETAPVGSTCDLYNVWTCLPYLYTNIRKCAPGTAAEREARCAEIVERVYAGVADAISVTYYQIEEYVMEDGSMSYCRGRSVTTTQGCPTTVPNTKEGDLGGYLIGSYNMIHYILDSLDLVEYEIPLFTEEDRVAYINAIRRSEPAEKDVIEITEPVFFDFEDTEIGGIPENMTAQVDSGRVPNKNSYVKVASDGTGNKVLEINSTSRIVDNGRNYSSTFTAAHTSKESTVTRLEFKFKINSISGNPNRTFDLIFTRVHTHDTLIQAYISVAGLNDVFFYETDGTRVGKLGKKGQWIDFAIEYDYIKGEYRVYAGGNLVGTGDSLYNNTANALAESIIIVSNSGVTANFYIDDLKLYTYKPE